MNIYRITLKTDDTRPAKWDSGVPTQKQYCHSIVFIACKDYDEAYKFAALLRKLCTDAIGTDCAIQGIHHVNEDKTKDSD